MAILSRVFNQIKRHVSNGQYGRDAVGDRICGRANFQLAEHQQRDHLQLGVHVGGKAQLPTFIDADVVSNRTGILNQHLVAGGDDHAVARRGCPAGRPSVRIAP